MISKNFGDICIVEENDISPSWAVFEPFIMKNVEENMHINFDENKHIFF